MTALRVVGTRTGLLVAVVLAALPLLPALSPGETLYYRDVGQNHFPNRLLSAEMIAGGSLPLWKPQRGAGQPFLANPNSLVLRPTSIFFVLLPDRMAPAALTLSILSLLALAGAGTWLFLRESGLSIPASILGAAAFSLSGAVQSLGQVMNHLEAVAWMPLTLWLLKRALSRGWIPWGAPAGISAGMLLSAGEPIWWAVLALAALALPEVRAVSWRRKGSVALVVALLGAGLASVQLLPLADLAGKTVRGEGLDQAGVLKWSLPVRGLAQTAVPGLWGDPTRANPRHYWASGLFDSSLPWLLSIHLGAPVLLLAITGAAAGRRTLPLVVLTAVAILLSLGRHLPAAGGLVEWIPGISSVRYPVKWFVLATWGLALLAAEGVDILSRPGRLTAGSLRAFRAGIAVAAAMTGAGLLAVAGAGRIFLPLIRWVVEAPAGIGDRILLEGAVPVSGRSMALSGAFALLAAVSLRRGGGEGTPVRTGIAVASACVVLLSGAWNLNPSAPADVVFERSPLLEKMPRVLSGEERIFSHARPRGFAYRAPSEKRIQETGLPADSLAWGMRWDVRTLRFATAYHHGLHGAYDQRGAALLDLLPGSAVAAEMIHGMPLDQQVRLMQAASAGYLLAYEDLEHESLSLASSLPGESNFPVRLYAVGGAMPRAYHAVNRVAARDAGEAIFLLKQGALEAPGSVVLEEGSGDPSPVDAAGATSGAASSCPARITTREPNQVSVEVDCEAPGWLVLADTYDPDWRAEVDGRPERILRANGMFRAVPIPPGAHVVSFAYRPMSFAYGLALALLSLAAAGFTVWRGRRTIGAPEAGAA